MFIYDKKDLIKMTPKQLDVLTQNLEQALKEVNDHWWTQPRWFQLQRRK